MCKFRIGLFGFLMFISTVASAVEPLGLKIGEMTLTTFEAQIKSSDDGTNSWTGGAMKSINVGAVSMDGLSTATAIFNRDEVLVGLLLTFRKDKFNSLNDLTKSQYELIRSEIPYVGNKFADYRDGDTVIKLNAPHMSFDMEMHFLHQSLLDAHKNGRRKQEAKEKSAEKKALFGN